MARYVEDLALALPIICGPDGRDPAVVPVALGDPAGLDPMQLRVAWYADNGYRLAGSPRYSAWSARPRRPCREVGLIENHLMPGMREAGRPDHRTARIG